MKHHDQLTSSDTDFVFAKPGESYAIYLPDGGSPELDLAGVKGTFEVKWYDDRNRGAFQDGSARTVEGGAKRNLGPKDKAMDSAVLVRRTGAASRSTDD